MVTSPILNDSTCVLFYTAELKHKQEMCLLWFFLTPHILILSEWVQFVSLFCDCWELFCYVRRFPILQPRAACSLFSRVRNRDVQLANSQRAFPPRHNTLSSCTYVHCTCTLDRFTKVKFWKFILPKLDSRSLGQ